MLLALFLVMGITASGIMGEACLCGGACLHGLQSKGEKTESDTFHRRCSETGCKSCSLEKGWTCKATNFSSANGSLKNFNAIFIISSPMIADSSIGVHETFGTPIHRVEKRQIASPYLQHVVLLL